MPEEREPVRLGRATEAIVLLMLAQGRSYGYEIRRRLEEFAYEPADSDAGALYRLLRELEGGSYIASEWNVEGTGPARRYYSLTPAGRERLQRDAERMATLQLRIEHFFTAYRALDDAQAMPESVHRRVGTST
ncbi:MAG TPA: PadR family transcriptional regulator [Chloroflexota bacterium]|nr:PadR family transcriptional regulator [Chloroflexota bacterium]